MDRIEWNHMPLYSRIQNKKVESEGAEAGRRNDKMEWVVYKEICRDIQQEDMQKNSLEGRCTEMKEVKKGIKNGRWKRRVSRDGRAGLQVKCDGVIVNLVRRNGDL